MCVIAHPAALFFTFGFHDARKPVHSAKGHSGSSLKNFSVTGELCHLPTRASNSICDPSAHKNDSIVADTALGGGWIPDLLGSRDLWFMVVFGRLDIQETDISENNVLPSNVDLGGAVNIQGLWCCRFRHNCVRSDPGASCIASLGSRPGEQSQLTKRCTGVAAGGFSVFRASPGRNPVNAVVIANEHCG